MSKFLAFDKRSKNCISKRLSSQKDEKTQKNQILKLFSLRLSNFFLMRKPSLTTKHLFSCSLPWFSLHKLPINRWIKSQQHSFKRLNNRKMWLSLGISLLSRRSNQSGFTKARRKTSFRLQNFCSRRKEKSQKLKKNSCNSLESEKKPPKSCFMCCIKNP